MADADDEIDRLYGLPAGEFTAARNELAKRLRKEGDKEEAERVAALKRPSAAAAAVNRLVREQRGEVDELMEAGDELRSAQADVLEGGDRDAMRAAQERERGLVAGLAKRAAEGASAAVREKVEETLRAAALGDEAREEVLAGRLEHELEPDAAGAFGVFGGGAPAGRPARATKKKAAPAKKEKKDAAGEKRKRRVAELEKRVEAEEKREAEARRRLEEAEGAAIDAKREADQAASRAKSAEAEAERRRERHEEAQAKADAARDELEKARG